MLKSCPLSPLKLSVSLSSIRILIVLFLSGDVRSILLQAEREGDQVLVSDGQRDLSAPADIMPTNHWNAAVLSRNEVLNTLTGDIDRVQIEPLGPGSISRADGQMLEARHYRYTGEIEADVWYDADGRWVGLRFEGKDGSEIVYRCERCGTSDFTGSNNAARPAAPDDRRPG